MEDVDSRWPERSELSDDELDETPCPATSSLDGDTPHSFRTFTPPRNTARRTPSIGRAKLMGDQVLVPQLGSNRGSPTPGSPTGSPRQAVVDLPVGSSSSPTVTHSHQSVF